MSYHTTPYSNIGETPFTLIYVEDFMLLVKIDTPSCRHSQLNEDENEAMLRCVDETANITHIREFSTKQRASRRYKSKVVIREMGEGNLEIRQVFLPTQQRKL